VAAADSAGIDDLNLAGDKSVHGVAHHRACAIEVDIDAGVVESGQRATADTGNDKRINAVGSQKPNRTQASALDMRRVIDDAHGRDRTVLDLYNGEAIASPEVA